MFILFRAGLGIWVAKLGSLLKTKISDLLAKQNQYYDTYYSSQTGISQVPFTMDFGSANYFAF